MTKKGNTFAAKFNHSPLLAIALMFAISSCAPVASVSTASITIELGSRSSDSSVSASASWSTSTFSGGAGDPEPPEGDDALLEANEILKLWKGSETFLLDPTKSFIVPSNYESDALRRPVYGGTSLASAGGLSAGDLNSFCYFVHVIPTDEDDVQALHENDGIYPHDIPATGEIFGPVGFQGAIDIQTDADQEVEIQLLGFANPVRELSCSGRLEFERSSDPANFGDGEVIFARPKVMYTPPGAETAINVGRRSKVDPWADSYFDSMIDGSGDGEMDLRNGSALWGKFAEYQDLKRNSGVYVFFHTEEPVELVAGDNVISLVKSIWNTTAAIDGTVSGDDTHALTPPLWGAEEEVTLDIVEEGSEDDPDTFIPLGHGIPVKSNLLSRWLAGKRGSLSVESDHEWRKFPPTLVQDISLLTDQTIHFQCPPRVEKVKLYLVSYSVNPDPEDQVQYNTKGYRYCEEITSVYPVGEPGEIFIGHRKAVFENIDLFPSTDNMDPVDPGGINTGDFTILIAVPMEYDDEPIITNEGSSTPYFETHGIRMWKFQQLNI